MLTLTRAPDTAPEPRRDHYDRRMSGILRTASAALLVLALAACSGPTPDPSATATPEPSSTSTSTPTPTPTPDASDPADWTIGFTGVGPIMLGGDIDQIRGSLVGFEQYGQDFGCPWVTYVRRDQLELWIPTEDPDYRIVRGVAVVGDGPRTAGGAHVGSAFAEVRAAHPDAFEGTWYGDNQYMSLSDGAGHWILFSAYGDSEVVATIEIQPYDQPTSEFCG
jgi:hypothetical protein